MCKRRLKIMGASVGVVAVLWMSWLTGTMILRHPAVDGLLGDLMGLVTGDCTVAGCVSSLTVLGEEFMDGVVYDMKLCLDHECWEMETTFEEKTSGSGDPLWVEHRGTITVYLENTFRPVTSGVSLVVWADGDVMVHHEGEVTFQVERPNGRFCLPTCYWGLVVV